MYLLKKSLDLTSCHISPTYLLIHDYLSFPVDYRFCSTELWFKLSLHSSSIKFISLNTCKNFAKCISKKNNLRNAVEIFLNERCLFRLKRDRIYTIVNRGGFFPAGNPIHKIFANYNNLFSVSGFPSIFKNLVPGSRCRTDSL